MLDIIVNVTAGDRKGKKFVKKVKIAENYLKQKNAKFTFHIVKSGVNLTEYTERLIEDGATNLIVMGGDGTLHRVLNGVVDFNKVTLGLIPCGTGNDFASNIKIPKNVKKAFDLVLKNQPKFVDYMQMPTTRGINVIGTGIDVDVLERFAKSKKKSPFTYTLSLLKSLLHFTCIPFNANYNGKSENYNAFIACVANGNSIGGGNNVCPIAKADDGILHFVTVSSLKRRQYIGAFIKLKANKIDKIKTAHIENANEVRITSTSPLTVQVDGEIYENIPFEVKIVSNELKMFL